MLLKIEMRQNIILRQIVGLLFGLVPKLGPLGNWGLDMKKMQLRLTIQIITVLILKVSSQLAILTHMWEN